MSKFCDKEDQFIDYIVEDIFFCCKTMRIVAQFFCGSVRKKYAKLLSGLADVKNTMELKINNDQCHITYRDEPGFVKKGCGYWLSNG